MKKILFLVFCLTCGFSLWGQTWQLGWQNCFGGTKEDYATDVVYFNHGYYMLGRTQSIDGDISFFHGGPDDVWLVRTDSTGNMLWEKTYGGSESEDSKRIFESTDGNLYILAGTNSTDGDITNNPFPMTPAYWFLKIDTTGNILWEKTLGGSGGDFETYATPTSDGGIVAIGYSNSSDGDVSVHYGAYDMWMVKLNAQGEKQWDFTLGNEDFDFPYAVIQTSDGGFLVGGSSAFTQGGNLSCNQHGKADAVVVKLDSLRNIEWTQCYGGSDYDGVTRLIEVADGYVFGGYTMSDDGQVTGWHGGDDIWIVKIDFQGSIVWQKCLGGTRNEYIKNISKESDGSYVLFGITQSYDGDVSGNHNIVPEVYDIWMVKLSSEGELISQQCIGGIGDDKLEFGVVQRKDGNYVAAGQMTNGPSYDVLCTPYSTPIPDYWLFELKDCTHYAPLTPSQPTGPTHACSASGEPARYTVPSLANQTHAWHLEPTEAGTLTTHHDTLTVAWTTTFEGTATLTARGVNDCGESGWSVPFYTQVETCAGIATHTLAGLRLWPNPATATFNLQLPAGATLPATLALSDLSGRMVLRQTLTETLSKIDCSRLVEGVYFWRVSLGDDQASGKIMIKK